MRRIKLREVVHARSGEKGNAANISVIAFDEKDYAIIRDQVTVENAR